MFTEYDRGVIRAFKLATRVGGGQWELPKRAGYSADQGFRRGRMCRSVSKPEDLLILLMGGCLSGMHPTRKSAVLSSKRGVSAAENGRRPSI